MNRDDVAKRVKEKFHELGIAEHVAKISKIPSKVEVTVLIGSEAVKLVLRSGITRNELEEKLGGLEGKWQQRMPPGSGHQVDLEEAIEAAE